MFYYSKKITQRQGWTKTILGPDTRDGLRIFLSGRIRDDHSAGQPFTGGAGGLCAVVIGALVNDDGMTDDVGDSKTVRVKTHQSPAVVGKQHRKIAGVIAMGLVGGIPMFSGRLKRIRRIADRAYPIFMNVKAVGTDGWLIGFGRPELWQSRQIHRHEHAIGDVLEKNQAMNIGPQRTPLDFGDGHASLGSGPFRLFQERPRRLKRKEIVEIHSIISMELALLL